MAACAMSISFGVPMDKIVEVLKVFKAVEHRIEYVTESVESDFTTIQRAPILMQPFRVYVP